MKISVIIPAYNATATLAETLDSIAAQERPADELIIADDGSTDGTFDLAQSHPLKPTVLACPHRGGSAAMNSAIRVSTGDLLAFVDADDLWLPHKLKLQEEALLKDSTLDAVFGMAENFLCSSATADEGKTLVYPKGLQPGYFLGVGLYRKALWDQVGLLDETLQTGWFIDWFDRAQHLGIRYRILDELVFRRRVRPNSLSRRTGQQSTQISSDFVSIARAAILRKKQREKTDAR